MATHSPKRASVNLLPGLELFSRGKVRDTYLLPDGNLLQVTTDGISIFDFVLDALVPEKGVVLNAMSHFWLQHLKNLNIKTHFIAAGADIDEYLPDPLKNNRYLQARAMVVRRLKVVRVEFIGRTVLAGSAKESYNQNLQVCGHKLWPGLQDGDALPYILDTPTTKAEEGHDENLSASEVREQYPKQTYLLLQIFQIASFLAEQRGIKVADTKLEFGEDGTVGDEVLTPDSSRFWELKTWQESRKIVEGRKAPPPYDKQFVRQWGIEQGINKLDPTKPSDVLKVHSLIVPDDLIRQTSQIYRYIFWRLTGYNIESYLCDTMGVKLQKKVRRIKIICGSKSDLPLVVPVVSRFKNLQHKIEISVDEASCHRNPFEVVAFATKEYSGLDAVICVGSKAFALPGVLDAFAYASKNDLRVIGVALGEPGSRAFEAAKLSIEELPGTPVIMDEITGNCYAGENGLLQAIGRVINGELPPPKPRTQKPVQLEVFKNF